MPVSVAARIFSSWAIGSFAIAARSPESMVLNGSTFLSSGFSFTSAPTRSRQYIACEYIGCSTQSVPSWSKVATRSTGGTNFGLPCVVVACTNSTIACFAAPSFHEGSGSVCANDCALAVSQANNANRRTKWNEVERFIGGPPVMRHAPPANTEWRIASPRFIRLLRADECVPLLHGLETLPDILD